MKLTTRGFTLIELLVVVLIIGVLAAVALPQYNKAVKKAQGAEVLASVNALDKALTSYYLEHGSYEGADANSIGIEMPELTHFQYSVGTGCSNKSNWNTAFTRGSTATGFSMDWCADNAELTSNWQKGKQNSFQCSGKFCTAYFNCKEKEYYPCGGPWCSASSRCYFD